VEEYDLPVQTAGMMTVTVALTLLIPDALRPTITMRGFTIQGVVALTIRQRQSSAETARITMATEL
jgi:hypothetical protein